MVAGPLRMAQGLSHSDGQIYRRQFSNPRPPEQDINADLAQFLRDQPVINKKTLREAAERYALASRIVIETKKDQKMALPPNFLSRITSLFPYIRELSIKSMQQESYVYNLSHAEFIANLPKLSKLTSIELESCPSLTADSFTALFKTCSQLQSANIDSNQLTNDHLHLALRIETLRTLIVSGKNSINDEGLKILGEKGSNLERLGVAIYPDNDQPAFSLKAAKAFAATLPQLNMLHFDGTLGVDGDFIQILIDNHQRLRELSLEYHQDNVPKEMVDEIAQQFPELEIISFGNHIRDRKEFSPPPAN